MKIIAVVLVCLIQLGVPASMILSYEDILSEGTEYRFKVRPVDPADPFRGRYVRLAFDEEEVRGEDQPALSIESIPDKQRFAFARIETGANGLAEVIALSGKEPTQGDFIKVDVRIYNKKLYRINFPFDRYYAEESKAPNIENVVASRRRLDEGTLITAQVHIKNGRGVIAELFVGGQTIHEYLSAEN